MSQEGIYTIGQFSRIAKRLSGWHTFEYVCIEGRYVFKIFDAQRPLMSRYNQPDIDSSGFVSVHDNDIRIIPHDNGVIQNEEKDNKIIKDILK